ncbi:MAG: TIGR00341 family protein [Desulfobacterales bacterium]
MKYVEVTADAGSCRTIAAIAKKHKAFDFRPGVVGTDGMQITRLLVDNSRIQAVIDTLQNVLGAQPCARITVLAVETVIPRPPEEDSDKKNPETAAREALYDSVAKNAELNRNFVVLVILSTVVAAIGLTENNVAVIIGAMVIAPLLGPNLAFALGAALGDMSLISKSMKTNLIGIAMPIALSFLIGFFWPSPLSGPEIMARTKAGMDSVVLALASGAAAALSLTTGLSSVLVGVMVAVALLPPAATIGLMLGQGKYSLAVGASLLLAINVVCVNLATKVVFFAKGIRPRTWLEKEKARRATAISVIIWIITLTILVLAIYARREMTEHALPSL